MRSRRSLAAITAWLAVSAALGDVIVMKTGEQITGTVTRFERGEHSLANSHFVVDVDGKEQSVLLFKVETVTFGKSGAPVTPRPVTASAVTTPAPRPSPAVKPSPSREKDSEAGDYWLSSTGKRHNSSCRYYKSAKGRACGPKDGTACKTCGG